MPKKKILGFKHLNKKFGLFDTNHNYNLSEKSIATKPYSFQLWAVSYIVDKCTDKFNFKDIAFMMMVSDLKYFEEHILPARTGWSNITCRNILNSLVKQGYFTKERPQSENAVYYDKTVKLTYKYYPSHKYRAFLKRIENELKDLHNHIDDYKRKGLEPPNRSTKESQGFSI